MLGKIIAIFLLASNLNLASANTINSGQVLGSSSQAEGDVIRQTNMYPQRINYQSLGPKISASKALVLDIRTNRVLFEKDADGVAPIASITKLMSLLTYLEEKPDLEKVVKVEAGDFIGANRPNLLLGERIRVKNLIHLALMASDNDAIKCLIRASGNSEEGFVKKMNQKAVAMGLKNTSFKDAVGLSQENKSTPLEVSKILQVATKHALINQVLQKEKYSYISLSNREHHIESTNQLLNSYLPLVGGKTGFTYEAGYCFAGLVKDEKRNLITVVLGADSEEHRFSDTQAMVDWVIKNYAW